MAGSSVGRNRDVLKRAQACWKHVHPGKRDPLGARGNELVKLTIVVPHRLRRAARVMALNDEVSLKEFVSRAIANEIQS